jgi:hypothetical protein
MRQQSTTTIQGDQLKPNTLTFQTWFGSLADFLGIKSVDWWGKIWYQPLDEGGLAASWRTS